MPNPFRFFRSKWRCLKRDVYSLTLGGRWADRLPYSAQHNLSRFWLDGFFATACDNIVLTYLTLYVLALGATNAQIGAMSALSSLSAAVLLLPGAMLVERFGRRKLITVAAGGGVARIMLPLLALLPLVVSGPAVVYVAMALSVTRDAFGNLALPAWTALAADIVPLEWRGRYFGSRNFAMSMGGMVTTFLVGALITRIGGQAGFQLALVVAFGLGMVSTHNFNQIREPKAILAPRTPGGESLQALIRDMRAQPGFLTFCAAMAMWNFSVNISGPFFTPYMAQSLKASAFEIGIFSVVTSLASLPALRLFGNLADRWGPRRVQLITGLIIPFVPWIWILSREPWHVVPINTFSGFLWAGYNLAAFNFLLTLTPASRRARFTALYQIVVTLALALGAAFGGVVATQWGYYAVFFLSGLGRMAGALFFARFVHAPVAGHQP
jgi:MFS family permease